MSEMAVTSVSMAEAYSPAAASLTARAMALDDTVRLRDITSSNSASLMPACGMGRAPPIGAPWWPPRPASAAGAYVYKHDNAYEFVKMF